MGHVYKLINDMDNAICCNVKALEMVNKKLSTYREHADEVSLFIKCMFRIVVWQDDPKFTKTKPHLFLHFAVVEDGLAIRIISASPNRHIS